MLNCNGVLCFPSSFALVATKCWMQHIILNLLVLGFNQVFSLILSSFVFCNFILPWLPSNSQGSISFSSSWSPSFLQCFYWSLAKVGFFFFLSRLPLMTSVVSTNSPFIFVIKSVWWSCESPSFFFLHLCLFLFTAWCQAINLELEGQLQGKTDDHCFNFCY